MKIISFFLAVCFSGLAIYLRMNGEPHFEEGVMGILFLILGQVIKE